MPSKDTLQRARADRRQGKAASTQAGEFVREEIEHIREGKHGARSTRQAIAIGLSKARRAGVDLPPPAPGKTSEKTRRSAASAYRAGQSHPALEADHPEPEEVSPKRSRATQRALSREDRAAASRPALARQARSAARRRSPAERSAAARKAARTRSPAARSASARKAARTRRARS